MTGNISKNQEEDFLLKNILAEFFHYWYIFVFFLIVFLVLAFLYNRYSAPVYKTGLKLMVSSSSNNRNQNIHPEEFLQGFQLVQHSKEIENEIVVLQSLPLIEETIKDLNFNISYYFKENFIPYRFWPFYNYPNLILREMYGNVPFEIVPVENHPQPVGAFFYIKIINDKEFSINVHAKDVYLYSYQEDAVIDKIKSLSLSKQGRFGDTIAGPGYSFRILLNSKYTNAFDDKDLYFSFQDIYWLTRSYQSQLEVEQTTLESSIVNILFKGKNISKANEFLNRLAYNYIQRDLTKKNYIAETTIEYIDRELSNISSSLTQAEGQLQYFRSQHQVMDIEQKNLQLSQYIQKLENQKNELLQNLRFYQELYKYFEENQNATNMLAPSSMGVDDQVLNTMIQQLATYNAQKNEMEQKNLQRNPRYKTLTNQIQDLRNSISENIRFYIRSTQSKLDEINSNLDRYKLQERQLPKTQRQLLGYERKFNLSNEIYNFLLQKRAEAQIAKSSIISDSEIIEPASYQGISSPKSLFNYAIAVFLAFFLPGAILFLKTYFSNKIITLEDIKKISTVPVSGKILHNNFKSTNLLSDYPSSPIAESFRALRTNLNLIVTKNESNIILITSSNAMEGKTFISFNLSVGFALVHKKVILLGFDLRKPGNMDLLFNKNNTPGISNYLAGDGTPEELIKPTDIKNLDIMLSGPQLPGPAEYIESEKTNELFEYLKSRYDVIILDTPPLGPVTDAYLLMKYANIILFVVRQNFTLKNTLQYNLEELEQMNLESFHLVLNDVRIDKFRYGRQYPSKYYAYDK